MPTHGIEGPLRVKSASGFQPFEAMSDLSTQEHLPPGPGETFDLGFPEGSLERLYELFRSYGDIYRLSAPAAGADIYVVSRPEWAKHVLVTNRKNYVKGAGIDRVRILLGHGIMVSEGDFWRQQRRLIQPAFHRRVIAGLSDLIARANSALVEKWSACAAAGEAVDVTQDTSELTLDITLRAIFGSDLDRIIEEQGHNPFALLTQEPERNLAFAFKFRSLANVVRACVERRRRERQDWPDFLGMLMSARDEKTGEAMSDRQLLDEVMTLIVAGHETTASALNWTWFLLAQHPEAEQRLREELDRVLAGEVPDLERLDALPYTRHVAEESLRLYPPGWLLTRRALREDVIGGYTVPTGTQVFVSPYIIHRHPAYWEQPERFDPDRFGAEQAKARPHFAYIPFSAGPRGCVGELLAMVEIQMHLATVAPHLSLERASLGPVAVEAQINLRTRSNLLMFPRTRSKVSDAVA
jgi:cytochrome P450